MACALCHNEFSSALEEKVGNCLQCIPEIVKNYDVVKTLNAVLIEKEKDLKKRLEESEEENRTLRLKISFRETLDAAEQKGKKAGELGLGPDQNPYEDKETRAFWEYGRYVASSDVTIKQSQAVMLWTIDCLDYVRQIADSETRAKVETIIAKLAPFLEQFALEKGSG